MELKNLIGTDDILRYCSQTLVEYFNNDNYTETVQRTNSRNTYSAINKTYYKHWNPRNTVLHMLQSFCGHYLKRKLFVAYTSANPNADTELKNIIEALPNDYQETYTNYNLIICYVSRGKTYIEEMLKNDERCQDITTLPQVESILKESKNDYIKIIKDFPRTRFTNNRDSTNEQTTTIVFTDTISEEFISKIVIMLPLILGITENEEQKEEYDKLIEIFEYFYNVMIQKEEGSSEKVIKLFNEYEQVCAICKENMDKFLEELATARSRKLKQNYQSQIDNLRSRIERTEKDIEEDYEDLYKLEREFAACNTGRANLKPFTDYLENAKTIEIIGIDPKFLKLRITAPFQYFRENDIEIYEQNKQSQYLQTIKNNTENTETERANRSILHKIFNTREYKLLAQAVITVSLNANTNSTSPLHFSIGQNLAEYTNFPNPHMFHFNCWERARNAITKAVSEDKFELMLAQMIAAVQSLNVAEAPSFLNRFMDDWFREDFQKIAHIIDETGTEYTYEKMIKIEKKKLKNKKLTNATPETNKTEDECTLAEVMSDEFFGEYIAPEPTNTPDLHTTDLSTVEAQLNNNTNGYQQFEIDEETGEVILPF